MVFLVLLLLLLDELGVVLVKVEELVKVNVSDFIHEVVVNVDEVVPFRLLLHVIENIVVEKVVVNGVNRVVFYVDIVCEMAQGVF